MKHEGESPGSLGLGLRTGALHLENTESLSTQRLTAAAATAVVDGSLGSSAQDNGSEGSVSDVAVSGLRSFTKNIVPVSCNALICTVPKSYM